jgi:hypothetical protein
MVKEFESVSNAMAEPDADFDALTKTMERLQVGWAGRGGGGGGAWWKQWLLSKRGRW